MIGRRQLLGLLGAPLTMRAVEPSILVHEHILVDFVGADGVSRSRYDANQVVAAAKPRLDEIVRLGCRRL
ncbi:MAG: hypothetical protein ABI693_00240 [Bryobacteraceae bacterium]